MTERLYYDDSYTTQFTARVVERLTHGDHPAVILDRTYFYPASGGQPHDTGTLEGIAVIDVTAREDDGAVIHVLAEPLESDQVAGQVDWARRFDHLQHHTGQHILTQAFVQTGGAQTVGFHLSPDSVTIDLDAENVTPDAVDAAEDLANRIVWENRPVIMRLQEIDESDDVRVRKRPKHLLTDGLRVIEVEGFDVTACGGTHVAHTGEIGLIKVLRTEKRGAKTRVEFRCGGRALLDYREKTRVSTTLMAALNCRFVETPESVARLQDEFRAAQSALKAATAQLLDYEAARLLAEAPRSDGITVVRAAFAGRDPNEVKLLAGKLAASPGVIALLGVAGEKAMFFFSRSADLPHDMGALLKNTLAALGGRGGGQPQSAQGGGFPAALEQVQSALDNISITA